MPPRPKNNGKNKGVPLSQDAWLAMLNENESKKVAPEDKVEQNKSEDEYSDEFEFSDVFDSLGTTPQNTPDRQKIQIKKQQASPNVIMNPYYNHPSSKNEEISKKPVPKFPTLEINDKFKN